MKNIEDQEKRWAMRMMRASGLLEGLAAVEGLDTETRERLRAEAGALNNEVWSAFLADGAESTEEG